MSVVETRDDEVLVIGYGNELRGDDGVGPYMAGQIARRAIRGVRTLALPQLVPELACDLARARSAIFIDARLADPHYGVHIMPLEAQGDRMLMTHAMCPSGLLALARILYGRAPRAWLVTIAGTRFDPGASLSSEALALIADALPQIERLIDTSSCHEEQR